MDWLHAAVLWVVGVVGHWGYPGIVFMMFLESSFIPFPSEVVMPPAGYLASKGEMNLYVAIFMGILGSWLGALLNYYLALWLGRPFFLKYGRYFFCPPETFAKVERFFQEHGEIGTFTGRLVMVVRQYISLPAGLARMNMAKFILYTGLGSGIWVAILAVLGYVLGHNEALILEYSKRIGLWLLVACAALIAAYVWWHRRRRAARAAAGPISGGGA